MAKLMTQNRNDSLLASISFSLIIVLLGGGLSILLVVIAAVFTAFPAIRLALTNSNTFTSIGLIYDIIGALLISYDAVAGTGALAQLLWYLKREGIPLSKRLLILFYLRSPPLKKEKDGANLVLTDIEQGRDVKNADFSERAIGERPKVPSQYEQFRHIQRPAVIKSFGFIFISLGFIMQLIAVNLPE